MPHDARSTCRRTIIERFDVSRPKRFADLSTTTRRRGPRGRPHPDRSALRSARAGPARPAHARRADRPAAPARSRPSRGSAWAVPHRHRGAARRRLARARRPCSRRPSGSARPGTRTWCARVGAAVGDEVRACHRRTRRGSASTSGRRWSTRCATRAGAATRRATPRTRWLTGDLATAYARGLRGDHPDLLPTAPTLKHFLGYNNETDRSVTSQQPAARGCCTSTSCPRSAARSRPARRSR